MKALVISALLLVPAVRGAVKIQPEQATTALAYGAAASGVDLINAGQPTLAAATVSTSSGTFPGSGLNDGGYSNDFAANTFFQTGVHFPATVTFDLDVSAHPMGYDISSVESFMGWTGAACAQANQDYTIEVSVVGSAAYAPVATVKYTPFSGSGGSYETHVKVSDDETGILARGVASIRFIFGDPGTAGTAPQGTVIRELDVYGVPAVTVPPPVGVEVTESFSAVDGAYAGDVLGSDLVNAGQPSLASFTRSVVPDFGVGGENDGTYALAALSSAAWYHASTGKMPATLSFELDVASHPAGYEINGINTYAGWKGGDTQTYANQKYSVEYRLVDSGVWQPLKSVDYSPFSSLTNTPANTKVALTSPAGVLATGVAALRFNLTTPARNAGANDGTVLQEIDVIGHAAGTAPLSTMISSPTSRSIVQRNSSGVGVIPISGTYLGSPNRIEARAVVMDDTAHSGASTGWQTIAMMPAGGSYSGALTEVAAGGWYQIEVRAVTGETPEEAAVVKKVGVGDIYITAGQSNSANHGTPPYTPADDRVSVRLDASGGLWRQGYDPMPIATGDGGSPWSRLGDQLAFADNIPVGFLCVGVGSTATSDWLPGSANYETRLKPAVKSFPTGGFRAILWHQGESDSIANVPAATYASRMATIIAATRSDSGWAVPWYVAEASFHPETHLSQEEPVAAGQRATVYADPLVFLGPTTDAFHLEDAAGGKVASDGVHFNAAGLMDHATQWRNILRGTAALAPRNGDFEDNQSPAVTGLAPLADGAGRVVNISTDNGSPSVLGWRILTADGRNAAAGNNGYFNPSASTYAAAVDSVNGGVLPGMAGKHVAVLDGGAAGNYFLNTTRANAASDTAYTLTVAIGVRDNPATFGGVRLDILADGQVVATASYTKTALDGLKGGEAAGGFTEVSLVYETGASVAAKQPLAIRIAKTGGAGTVLDFDNVRFTAADSGYSQFLSHYFGSSSDPRAGSSLDPDGDGLSNRVEYFLGLVPLAANSAPRMTIVSGAEGRTARYVVPLDPAVTEPGFELQYSFDLQSWLPVAGSGDDGVISTRTGSSWTVEIALGTHPRAFLRMVAP